MNRRKIDQLCVALVVIVGALTIALCIVGAISAAARRHAERVLEEQFATDINVTGKMAYDAWEPVLAVPEETAEEDPDEGAQIYAALLDKCQCVEDCWIVGYAPELVEGWKPEYRNENSLYLTASGTWAMPGLTVATDPAIIPTGSTVIIEGRVYVAADRGVTGKVIDVMVTPEEALVYGARKADVYWCREGE